MGSVRSRDAVAAWGVYKKCENTSCWHFPLKRISSLSPQPSSLVAPATQAAQGFMSCTYGWQRGQPLSLGVLAMLLWRRCLISCPRPLSLCTEPCGGPAVTSFSETPGETKESVSCVPVVESKSEEQPGPEPQKETEACPKIHSRRFRE